MIRLCFVGPMVGRHPGYVTTQGERLASFLSDSGYPVTAVSSQRSRVLRLADVVATLVSRGRRVDVMMLEVYGGWSFVLEDVASWLGRRFDHRVVMTLHGGAIPEFLDRFPRWSRRVLRRADVLVAPSPYLARAAAPLGFTVRVIPNSIDLPAYPYRHRRTVAPRLFWMRTFHDIYNPSMAVRAVEHLKRTFPDASLVMAGRDKGAERDARLESLWRGVSGQVRFLGFLDTVRKVREAARADIFVSTSRIDNTPVAVVEACAMGLPVVSTRVGGVPDLLTDGETGLLVPDDDDRALAEAVERLVKDAPLASRLSANGRALAERFAWETVRPQWEHVFAGD
jgi:glycosyltransferase involved in cell wall biosynthesis